MHSEYLDLECYVNKDFHFFQHKFCKHFKKFDDAEGLNYLKYCACLPIHYKLHYCFKVCSGD